MAKQFDDMNTATLESVNKPWCAAGSVAGFSMPQGFVDEGERAACAHRIERVHCS